MEQEKVKVQLSKWDVIDRFSDHISKEFKTQKVAAINYGVPTHKIKNILAGQSDLTPKMYDSIGVEPNPITIKYWVEK